MRNTIIAAAAALVIGAAGGGALLANAQPAPPPPAAMDAGPGPHEWMRRMHDEHRAHPMRGTFALVYGEQDRALTPADVQKIAEAFLLWRGNHTWKVTGVAATPDGPIGFAVATSDGSVIAKFTMDPHTGRVTRTG